MSSRSNSTTTHSCCAFSSATHYVINRNGISSRKSLGLGPALGSYWAPRSSLNAARVSENPPLLQSTRALKSGGVCLSGSRNGFPSSRCNRYIWGCGGWQREVCAVCSCSRFRSIKRAVSAYLGLVQKLSSPKAENQKHCFNCACSVKAQIWGSGELGTSVENVTELWGGLQHRIFNTMYEMRWEELIYVLYLYPECRHPWDTVHGKAWVAISFPSVL